MTYAHAKAALSDALEAAREHASDLTRAMAGEPIPAVVRARAAMAAAVVEISAAIREFEESGSAIKTPLRPPSSANLAATRGIAERVGAILDRGRKT